MTTRRNKKWSRMEDMIILSNMGMKPAVLAERMDRTTAAIYNRRLFMKTRIDKLPVKQRMYRESLHEELGKGQLSFDFSAPPAPKVPTRVITIKSDRPAVKPITPPVFAPTPGQRPYYLPLPNERRTLRARFLAWLQRG
jgi:hypothetical protein